MALYDSHSLQSSLQDSFFERMEFLHPHLRWAFLLSVLDCFPRQVELSQRLCLVAVENEQLGDEVSVDLKIHGD